MQVSSSFGFQLLLDATADGVHRLFYEQISRILYICVWQPSYCFSEIKFL